MKLLVLVIVLLGCVYVLGDYENPTLYDKFMLSRLDLLSRHYRDNRNDQVTIEYYGTMKTRDVKSLKFPNGLAHSYAIHSSLSVRDLGCHRPKVYKPKSPNTFNNYVLIPRYPTANEINDLNDLASDCKDNQLPQQFRSYVVGYLGNPPNNTPATIIKRRLIVIQVPVCDNPPPNINQSLPGNMKVFINEFQQSFDNYKLSSGTNDNQYAVVYYGPDITQATAPHTLFLNKTFGAQVPNGWMTVGNDWIASLQGEKKTPKQTPKHSEYYLTHSVQCSWTQNHDIYLYTNFSPCTKCANEILNFAKNCYGDYKSFNVFYRYQWRDCLQSSYYIKNDPQFGQLKMNFFQLN